MNFISISFIFSLCLITIYFIYDKIMNPENYKLLSNIGNSPITRFKKPFKTVSTTYDDDGKYTDSRYIRNERKRN